MLNRRKSGHRTIFGALLAGALGIALTVPQLAVAAPSQGDIDAAREAEHLAELSVAQLEVYLATAQENANNAVVAAQQAAEDLNEANVKLDEATALAKKARGEADQAQADFESGRQELAAIAQTAYRSGSASLDALAPYLTSDGLETVESHQNIVNSFGSAVDTKLQEVAALQQVAKVMADSAEKAQAEQEHAVEVVAERETDARNASDQAQAAQAQADAQYQAGLEELAVRQNTTADLVRQQQEAIQAQREEAARQAAIEQAAAEESEVAPAPSRPSSSSSSGSSSSSNSGSSSSSESSNSSGSSSSGSSSSGSSSSGSSSSGSSSGGGDAPAPSSGTGAEGAIAFAKSVLGAPYWWAGEGPGYDCSGLVTVAYRSVGIYLTHQSKSQWDETYHVPVGNAQAGDLIFWSSNGSRSGIYHVAIYLGGGQIIEAPTEGVPVRITSIYSWGSVMPYAGRVV